MCHVTQDVAWQEIYSLSGLCVCVSVCVCVCVCVSTGIAAREGVLGQWRRPKLDRGRNTKPPSQGPELPHRQQTIGTSALVGHPRSHEGTHTHTRTHTHTHTHTHTRTLFEPIALPYKLHRELHTVQSSVSVRVLSGYSALAGPANTFPM